MATSSGQLSPPLPPSPQYASPPITTIVTLIILIFFFVVFFSIYFCRCFLQNIIHTWYIRHNPTTSPTDEALKPPDGLDCSIVQAYPTFNYSSVKGYRREKYGLECAICLIEFEEVDTLRLLTPCCHVFHQECIDLWLESHKTCPVCRRDLASPVDSPVKSCQILREIQEQEQEEEEEEDTEDRYSFSIKIREDGQDYRDERKRDSGKVVIEGDYGESNVDKFCRSCSTGHSIVNANSSKKEDEEDRFTLRLPEHVKSNIIKGHHNCSRSWTTFGDNKSWGTKGNVGLGEVSGAPSEGGIHSR